MKRWASAAALVLSVGTTADAGAPDAGQPPQGQPRVLRTTRSAQKNVKPPPEMEVFKPPPPPPAPRWRRREGPDEEMLWQLLRQGQYAAVLDGVAQTRAKYPQWTPPPKLLALVQEGQARTRVDGAIRHGRAEDVFEHARTRPDLFSCDHVDHLWALAKAHASRGQTAKAAEVYERVLKTCPNDNDRLAALYEAKGLLDHAAFLALVNDQGLALRTRAGRERLAQIRYDLQLAAIVASYDRKDHAAVSSALEANSATVVERHDGATAMLGAWTYYHLEKWSDGERWLRLVLEWDPGARDAGYLLGLTLFRAGRLEDAEQATAAVSKDDPRRRPLLADIRFAMAQRSYDAKDYVSTMAQIAEAEALGKTGVEVGRLRAWTRFHQGEHAAAAAEFSALYRESPDADLAEGVLQSKLRQGKRDQVMAMGQQLGGPLGQRTSEVRAQELREHKLFVAASVIAPEGDPYTDGMRSPRLSVYSALRRKQAGGGTADLEMFKFVMVEAAFFPVGAHEIQLRVDGMRLSSSESPDTELFGRRVPSAPHIPPPLTEEEAWEPRLGWRREGETVTPFAEVGTTPVGALLSPRPTWRLGAAFDIPKGAVEAQFRGQPIRDSLLSYTGMIDPYTGEAWGRVHSAGVSFWGYSAPRRWLATSFRGIAERLYGQGVQTNTHLGTGASAGVAARFSGVDQLSIGPYVDADRHEHHLGATTLGHGGYFSPRLFLRYGIYADLLTAEMRRFMIKARVAVGLAYKETDFTPYFPLEAKLPEYAAETQSDLDYSAELVGGVALGRHLQLGGAFSLRRSRIRVLNRAPEPGDEMAKPRADYNDIAALLVLRGSWEGRSLMVSRDLPSAALSDMYSGTGWP